MVAALPGEGSSATASAVDDCRSLAASSTSQYSGVVGRSELASLPVPVPVRRKGDDDADGASDLADGGGGGTSLAREGEVLRTHT